MIIQQVCLEAFRYAESRRPLFWANSIKESVGHFFVPSHDRFRTLKVEVRETRLDIHIACITFFIYYIFRLQVLGQIFTHRLLSICKLQYLDLTMASITTESLNELLSHCKHLKKLSLEHLSLNQQSCR